VQVPPASGLLGQIHNRGLLEPFVNALRRDSRVSDQMRAIFGDQGNVDTYPGDPLFAEMAQQTPMFGPPGTLGQDVARAVDPYLQDPQQVLSGMVYDVLAPGLMGVRRGAGTLGSSSGRAGPQYVADIEDPLLTIHNLGAHNLRAADDLGGLPVPSLAITKAEHPLESFGDISLIGTPDLATPGRGNPVFDAVFDADVYSPRYPDPVYRTTKQSKEALRENLADSIEAYERIRGRRSNIEYVPEDLSGREAVREMQRTPEVAHAFLKDQGYDADRLLKDAYDNPPSSGANPSYVLERKIREEGLNDGYDRFAENLLSSSALDRRIFKGFTNAGNRRYAKYNLENVVKEMKGTVQGGENFTGGAGTMRAQVAKKFRTLGGIQKERGRIVSSDAMTALKDEANDRVANLASRMGDYSKYRDRNQFIEMDANAERLSEIMTGKSRWDDYYEGVPDEVKKEVYELAESFRSMPTEYFEAKPQRAVGISEFVGAVVPDEVPDDVIAILKRYGLRVEKYGTPEQRRAAMQKFKDVMFSAVPFTPGMMLESDDE
jgi:hypothetical protein